MPHLPETLFTRRAFRAATRWNHGERMPSDTRASYLCVARPRATGTDKLLERARFMRWRNDPSSRDAPIATLAVGTKARNVAVYRARHGLPLLG